MIREDRQLPERKLLTLLSTMGAIVLGLALMTVEAMGRFRLDLFLALLGLFRALARD